MPSEDVASYVPTPEAIRAECDRLKESWDEDTREQRAYVMDHKRVYRRPAVEPPVISLADVEGSLH